MFKSKIQYHLVHVLQTGRLKNKLLRHAFPLSLYFKQRLLFCLEGAELKKVASKAKKSSQQRESGKFEKYILCAKVERINRTKQARTQTMSNKEDSTTMTTELTSLTSTSTTKQYHHHVVSSRTTTTT